MITALLFSLMQASPGNLDNDLPNCSDHAAACAAAEAAADAAERGEGESPQPNEDCDNASTQLAMNLCALEDYENADAALNAQWAITAGKMKERDEEVGPPTDGRPSFYDALVEAQRAWLAFRDTNCRMEGFKLRGGSAEPMEVSGCMAIMTRARTAELHELIETY